MAKTKSQARRSATAPSTSKKVDKVKAAAKRRFFPHFDPTHVEPSKSGTLGVQGR